MCAKRCIYKQYKLKILMYTKKIIKKMLHTLNLEKFMELSELHPPIL